LPCNGVIVDILETKLIFHFYFSMKKNFFLQMTDAVKTMSEVANGNYPSGGQVVFEGPGELAAALDDFDASLVINPLAFDEGKHRKTLEESLESIISGAALLADSRYVFS